LALGVLEILFLLEHLAVLEVLELEERIKYYLELETD
jgi:hypothetical protein